MSVISTETASGGALAEVPTAEIIAVSTAAVRKDSARTRAADERHAALIAKYWDTDPDD